MVLTRTGGTLHSIVVAILSLIDNDNTLSVLHILSAYGMQLHRITHDIRDSCLVLSDIGTNLSLRVRL